VDDEQLSVAIGKRGQNVRLAAKLTGWNIDVRSEADKRREAEVAMGLALPQASARPFGPKKLPRPLPHSLMNSRSRVWMPPSPAIWSMRVIQTPNPLNVTAEQLMQVEGMDQDLAFRLIDAVQAHFGE